jgi:hypothetical protein
MVGFLSGLQRALRPFVLLVAAAPLLAQDPVRPWRDWRTIVTPTHRLHFTADLEAVAREVASRIEGIDSAIAANVGSNARKPIDVVIDDPYSISNGYALPFLDRPVTVWWATPPDPRSDIGNFTSWSELLAIHELTHLAHLNRPSRNPFLRRLWSALPANLGPVARKSPRWVFEGYATLVEGQISGTGRPNNAWRPAILRQWAIEGNLPTYGELSMSGDFNGGDFAYLSGSAYLEWLQKREGDSTLVHVWRRLSARHNRSFTSAFAGVYGDAPGALYGRHAAELTRDAMAAKAALERAGIVEGELVQRLSWLTGDPAISPDGKRAVIALRDRERPTRVVVWKTTPEAEDTAAARRRREAQAKDPEDVPDRRFYPIPKRPEKVLPSEQGRAYQMPRWFPDNRRVLVTRWVSRSDGSLSPALYVWDTERGETRRITPPVGVLQGDPHPTENVAVAMQCRSGHCDIVSVDLARGTIRTLLEGNARLTYYRPRWSPDGTRILASVAEHGRWRVVVAARDGTVMRAIDPDDGANRYDGDWISNDSVVVVSELGGIANLEIIRLGESRASSLTRVTGAAVAPSVNRADGSIWFLSLHSRGLDVRRIGSSGARADSTVRIDDAHFGWAGARVARPREIARSSVGETRPYGGGPRHARWLPSIYGSADGFGGGVTLYSGDIVGRLALTATGAYGENGAWQGGALRGVWRYPRVPLEFGVFGGRHEPSRGRDALAGSALHDAQLLQGVLAFSNSVRGEGWQIQSRAGGGVGPLHLVARAGEFTRALGFVESELFSQQLTGASGLATKLRLHFSYGSSEGAFHRGLASLEVASVGRDVLPFSSSITAGRVVQAPNVFEAFSIGGGVSPVMDSSLIRQRQAMPMLPSGTATGEALVVIRGAVPLNGWTLFYESAGLGRALSNLEAWHRVVGLETRYDFGPVPVAFAPRMQARGGLGYSLSDPFRKRLRVFLEMRIEP